MSEADGEWGETSSMAKSGKEIGLAVIGCGTIGRIRAEFARDYPGVGWLGLCDVKEDLGRKLVDDTSADFFTTDFNELLARPEVTAAIIATDENHHVDATLAAVDAGLDLFIEKPLATDAKGSAQVLNAIEQSGLDAVVGYTNRFRRRFLAVKEKLDTNQIGDWSNGVVRSGVGDVHVKINSDVFASQPICACVTKNGGNNFCSYDLGGSTATKLKFRVYDNNLSGASDRQFQFICVGPEN